MATASGTLNDILAASGTDTNFLVKLQISDVDLATSTDTMGESAVDTVITTTELRQGVAAGATITLGPSKTGQAYINVPDNVCTKAIYLCAILYRGSTTAYYDASAAANPTSLKPNTTCLDISGQRTCLPGG